MFFRDGRPVNAQFGKLQANRAIREIFALGDIDIKMYNTCPVMKDFLRTNCSKMIMDNKDIPPAIQPPKKNTGRSAATGLAGLFMKVRKNK